MREGIAEESADAKRHIDARAAQFTQGNRLHAIDAARLRIPDGLHSQESERFGDIVALSPHLRCSPDAEADHFGIRAFFLEIARQRLAGQLLTHLPRGGGRQRARIDRIEVAAGGQNARHAARGRARGTSRNIAAFQRIQNVRHFFVHALEIGNESRADIFEHGGYIRQSTAPMREPLDFLDRRRLESTFFQSCQQRKRELIKLPKHIGMRVAERSGN